MTRSLIPKVIITVAFARIVELESVSARDVLHRSGMWVMSAYRSPSLSLELLLITSSPLARNVSEIDPLRVHYPT